MPSRNKPSMSDKHRVLLRAGGIVLLAVVVTIAVTYENFALAAVTLILPLALMWPAEFALGAFAFLTPLQPLLTITAEGTTLNWFVGAAAGILLLATGFLSGRFEAPSLPAYWWAAFMGWSMLTLAWAVTLPKGRVITAISLFLLYVVIACYRISRRELAFVFLMTILGGVVASAYSWFGFVQGLTVDARATLVSEERAASPNFFASSLLLPLSLAVGYFLSRNSRRIKMLSLGGVGVLGFTIFLTMSRGALVALFALTLVYCFRFRLAPRVLVPALVLGVLILLSPELLFVRIEESVASRAQGRWDIWKAGLEALKHHWILGAGLSNFAAVYQQYAGVASNFQGYLRSPHNVYLGVWVETGLIGLFTFLGAAWTQLKQLRQLVKAPGELACAQMVALEAALVAVLVHGLAAELLWAKSFWLVMFMAALATRLQQATAFEQTPATAVSLGSAPNVQRQSAVTGVP